jgi:hypothetical protein
MSHLDGGAWWDERRVMRGVLFAVLVMHAGCIFAATQGGYRCQTCSGTLLVNKVRNTGD